MTTKYSKATSISLRASLSLLLLVLAVLCLDLTPALAVGNSAALPSLAEFSKTVQNGQKDVVRGVYVKNLLALPVVQQPEGNATYVSSQEGEVTEFSTAAQYGNVGLLAHNFKAGRFFFQLTSGQDVQLIYGDGHVETFVIKKVLQFQALEPTNPFSSFRNLDKDETLDSGQMFNRAYAGERHLTFQTCIAAEGNPSWGRIFVIALPRKNVQIHYQHNPR